MTGPAPFPLPRLSRRRAFDGAARLAAGGVLPLLAGACGFGAAGQPAGPSQVEGAFTAWTYPLSDDDAGLIWRPLMARFVGEQPKARPDVQVLPWTDVPKLPTAVASGTPPDLVYMGTGSFIEYTDLNALLPIDSVITDQMRRDYFPHVAENIKVNGKTYGAPSLLTIVAPFYNLELVERAGLNPNALPTTWQQLEEWAAKLHRPGSDEIAVSHNWSPTTCSLHMLNWFPQSGAVYFDERDPKTPLLNSKEGVEALEFPKRLFDRGFVPDEGRRNEGPAFTTGKVGINLFNSNGNPRTYAKNFPTLRYRAGPILQGKKRAGFSNIGCYVAFKDGKNHAGSLEWLRFMQRPPNLTVLLRESGYMPPIQSLKPADLFADDEQLRRLAEEARYAQPGPRHRNAADVNTLLAKHTAMAIRGEVSPRQAMDEANRELKGAIDRVAR
jgi:multiple sugar transport system substrate-binding protein